MAKTTQKNSNKRIKQVRHRRSPSDSGSNSELSSRRAIKRIPDRRNLRSRSNTESRSSSYSGRSSSSNSNSKSRATPATHVNSSSSDSSSSSSSSSDSSSSSSTNRSRATPSANTANLRSNSGSSSDSDNSSSSSSNSTSSTEIRAKPPAAATPSPSNSLEERPASIRQRLSRPEAPQPPVPFRPSFEARTITPGLQEMIPIGIRRLTRPQPIPTGRRRPAEFEAPSQPPARIPRVEPLRNTQLIPALFVIPENVKTILTSETVPWERIQASPGSFRFRAKAGKTIRFKKARDGRIMAHMKQ